MAARIRHTLSGLRKPAAILLYCSRTRIAC
jgi:hypothetical protein